MTFVGGLHSKVIRHSTAFLCGQVAGCLVMVGPWAQGVGAACCWCVRTASYRYVCAGHPWCLGFPCFALFGCSIASLSSSCVIFASFKDSSSRWKMVLRTAS